MIENDGENEIYDTENYPALNDKNALLIYKLIFDVGRNVFLTGMGGTGKTYTLNNFIKICIMRGQKIVPTSTTGVSAVNIFNGNTIHSALGLRLARESAEILAGNIRKYKDTRSRWLQMKVLIIDECSMMGNELFDKIEEISRIIRRSNTLFGGVKLLLIGDMLQLPPVKEDYIFESETWQKLDLVRFILKKSQRFTDKKFFRILSRIRDGQPNDSDLKNLKKRYDAYVKKEYKKNDIKPTVLFGTKKPVDELNERKIDKLPGKLYNFNAVDTVFDRNIDETEETGELIERPGKIREEESSLLEDLAPRQVKLRVGAQVMLTRNIDILNGLINGSRGIVRGIRVGSEFDPLTQLDVKKAYVNVEFCDGTKRELQKVSFERIMGKKRYVRWQIPLILAWAVTIHKSQSSTIDKIIVDIGSTIFCDGQAYVALSRVRSLDGLFISNLYCNKIRANEKALAFEELQIEDTPEIALKRIQEKTSIEKGDGEENI